MPKYSWARRLLFSAYYSFGFCLIVYFVNILGKRHFNVLYSQPIEYPFGFCIAIVSMIGIAAALFVVCLFVPLIVSRLSMMNFAFSIFLLDALLFYVAVGLTLIFFGFDVFFVVDGLVYGTMFGIMDALGHFELDFSFINDNTMSEQVKILKLNVMYDKWFRSLFLFTTFLVAIIVSAGLQWVLATPEKARFVVAISIAVIGLYVSIGIFWCIYWNIIKKINLIDSKILSLRKDNTA